MTQRLTKMEAAAHLDVSASTIDRMIQRGELQIETEPHGSRHRVWVVMDDEEVNESVNSSREISDSPPDSSSDTSNEERPDRSERLDEVELAVLRERVKSLEELGDYHRELLKDSEWRYQQAMEQLNTSQRTVEAFTKALPEAASGDLSASHSPRRSWWPFGRSKR